jgi:hypothetical protein
VVELYRLLIFFSKNVLRLLYVSAGNRPAIPFLVIDL